MTTLGDELQLLQGQSHLLNTFLTPWSTLEMLYRRYGQRMTNVVDSKFTKFLIVY